ncbi:hypothetical protein APS56_16410 [Pseudalgibacter alginicilyticus]|uniref:YbbR-like domain-containing protein n=1 Tax=Pseudalgibacter alginicilyticus TaxID=1736674 RepID=A0A0P0DD36_9FLAO|nr:hypothetical protein APS56_16410 [Pseudalgibacter alginicilyticus]
MKILKSKIIREFEKGKINVFLLFLLLSFTILIFTKLSKQYTNTIVFKINKIHVPDEVVILNDADANLHITLKTHGFGWLKYYLKQPTITIDFAEEVSKTPTKFIWQKSKVYLNNTQFGKQEEILNISPDTLLFNYDNNMVKKVPVILNSNIQFSPGFDVFDDLETNPDSVVVIGAEEIVTKIKHIETELLTLNDVKGEIKKWVALKLPQKNNELKFSDKSVLLKANVERFTEGVLKLPINILNIPEGLSLNYFPKTVNVTFYTSLDNFKGITPKDFKVECDFGNVSQSQSFLVPKLVKEPKAVKNARLNEQRIEFIIKE